MGKTNVLPCKTPESRFIVCKMLLSHILTAENGHRCGMPARQDCTAPRKKRMTPEGIIPVLTC